MDAKNAKKRYFFVGPKGQKEILCGFLGGLGGLE